MSGTPYKPLHADDELIPEPVYFARQLGWTKGWSKAWSWWRLADHAGHLYWANRPEPRAIEETAA